MAASCIADPGHYVTLRFVILTLSASIALFEGIIGSRKNSKNLALAFGLFVVARIIRQYL